jgi:hypothetical protein
VLESPLVQELSGVIRSVAEARLQENYFLKKPPLEVALQQELSLVLAVIYVLAMVDFEHHINTLHV